MKVLYATALLAFCACRHNSGPLAIPDLPPETTTRTFSCVTDVADDPQSTPWVSIGKNGKPSAALFFNAAGKDTLKVECSPDCWLYFPIRRDPQNIVVLWDNLPGCKYVTPLVSAIDSIDGTLHGQPFMILQLKNGHTLVPIYYRRDVREILNAKHKDRVLFPDRFEADPDFLME